MINIEEKKKALSRFLAEPEKDIEILDEIESRFTIDNEEYLVLTDEEAEAETESAIASSLWAFNSDFIISHASNYSEMTCEQFESACEALQDAQSKSCESLNPLMLAIIEDFGVFVEDAIAADGRGHFLAYWDGQEYEQETDEGEILYIYRIN